MAEEVVKAVGGLQSCSEKGYDSNHVMAYIYKKCADNNVFVNVTKLQKLLYCCYGVILAKFDARLTQEHPKAWQYGPVFPRTFNAWRRGEIQKADDRGFSLECPPEWLKWIDAAIRHYGKYSATQLSRWSHAQGSPWSEVTDNGKNLLGELDDFTIAKFFRGLIKGSPDGTTARAAA